MSHLSPTVITISDNEVTRLEYQGQPVVTFLMIDKLHRRVEGTARDRFKKNRKRFVEGVDFFHLTYQETTLLGKIYPSEIRPNPNGMILQTQTGYLMLVKSFTDDFAWQVQRELINKYFTSQEILLIQKSKLKASQQELLMARPKWKRILRYRYMGLSQRDIGTLLGVTQRCIWGQLARMKKCGIIATTGALVPEPD